MFNYSLYFSFFIFILFSILVLEYLDFFLDSYSIRLLNVRIDFLQAQIQLIEQNFNERISILSSEMEILKLKKNSLHFYQFS